MLHDMYTCTGAAALSILSSDVSNQLCQLCGYDTTTDLDPPKVHTVVVTCSFVVLFLL